jgi:hypothetical protein
MAGERQKPASEMSDLELVTVKIHQQMNDPRVARGWGHKDLDKHAAAPRVVWVRQQSPIESPKQAGGRLQGKQGEQEGTGVPVAQDGSRWRIARVRVQTVDVHLYGRTEAETDRLLKNVIAAIETAWPQVSYIFEDWTEDSHTHLPKAVMRLQLRLTVADEVQPLKLVEGEAHECGILQEDGWVSST